MKLKRFFVAGIMAFSIFGLAGCGNDAEPTDTPNENTEETTEETSQSEADTSYLDDIAEYGLPQLEDVKDGDITAVISTNKGDITVKLFDELAPVAVENFMGLANDGYYNGVIFHRVIDNFMIQGGDPTGTGTGGESYFGESFGLETTPSLRHFRGALAMANTGQPNSNGSQFYIVQQKDLGDNADIIKNFLDTQDDEVEEGSGVKVSDIYPPEVCNEYLNNGGAPYLDGNYTVFGQVVDGMDVVDQIAAVETDENDKPIEDIVIKEVKINE